MSPDTEASSQDLVPGIPNDVTLNQITTKLLWRDFYILSSVSRAWCHAIRSRQVYNIELLAVLEVNDELLAVVHWWQRDGDGTFGYCLVRSKGLSSKTEEMRWQKALELTLILKGLVPEDREADPAFLMHSFEL
ncbi:unnamed protein product [Calypogeia fissa]